jgi:hypothetical protein
MCSFECLGTYACRFVSLYLCAFVCAGSSGSKQIVGCGSDSSHQHLLPPGLYLFRSRTHRQDPTLPMVISVSVGGVDLESYI